MSVGGGLAETIQFGQAVAMWARQFQVQAQLTQRIKELTDPAGFVISDCGDLNSNYQ